MLKQANIVAGASACDVGAGVAHLTLMLQKEGLQVTSVEPNDAMRNLGIKRTAAMSEVTWVEGTGEQTSQKDGAFDIVTFGSSFNVCDRQKALAEAARILKDNGWFVCMWNHRDLEDPIQADIEAIIKSYIPEYGYGTRREDQVEVINESALFSNVYKISGSISHTQKLDDVVEAWRSHATLERQAGENFSKIVDEIEAYLKSSGLSAIDVPYTTNIWMAQKL